MNVYAIVALAVFILLLAHAFNLGPAIEQLVWRIADVPELNDHGDNPALYTLAVRLAYLIALVGIIKLLIRGRKGDSE
ncbi:MAG: hypothetical protein ACYSUN_12945 [Planctomycetota bacterium]|jgi:hypothetical protein